MKSVRKPTFRNVTRYKNYSPTKSVFQFSEGLIAII